MKTRILLALIITGQSISAQISYRDVSSPKIDKFVYDSTVNFNQIRCDFDAATLIGQEITFIQRNPKYKGYSSEQRDTFITGLRAIKPTLLDNIVDKSWESNTRKTFFYVHVEDKTLSNRDIDFKLGENFKSYTYKPALLYFDAIGKMEVITPYNALENRTFKIVEFVDSSFARDANVCLYKIVFQDKDGEQFSWTMNSNYLPNVPMLINGYFEKIKSTYLNKWLYFQKSSWTPQKYRNPIDGKEYNYQPEKKWQCIDVTFLFNEEFRFGEPFLILKDEQNLELAIQVSKGKSYLSLNDIWTEEAYLTFKYKEKQIQDSVLAKQKSESVRIQKEEKEYRANMIKWYGVELGTIIADGKVKLGMSKSMCEGAWGWPYKKTTTLSGANVFEVWFYNGGQWLKFVNNKLIQITE